MMPNTLKKRNPRRHQGVTIAVTNHLDHKVAGHIQIETEKVHRANQVTGPHLHCIKQIIPIKQSIRINHRANIETRENLHHHRLLRHQNFGHRVIRLRVQKKSE